MVDMINRGRESKRGILESNDLDKQGEEDLQASVAEMLHLEARLNDLVGKMWYRHYYASLFWSNASTLLGLSLTLLSALTATEATTGNFLSEDNFKNVSVALLVLSSVNSFFKPTQTLAGLLDNLSDWNNLGIRYETCFCNGISSKQSVIEKIKVYRKIHADTHSLRARTGSADMDFSADIVFYLVHLCKMSKTSCSCCSLGVTGRHGSPEREQNDNEKQNWWIWCNDEHLKAARDVQLEILMKSRDEKED